jgi:hypothetical protein
MVLGRAVHDFDGDDWTTSGCLANDFSWIGLVQEQGAARFLG